MCDFYLLLACWKYPHLKTCFKPKYAWNMFVTLMDKMFSGEPAKDSSRYWNKKTTLLWKKENKMAYNVTRKTLEFNSLASGTCIFLLFTNVHLLQYTITAWNVSPPDSSKSRWNSLLLLNAVPFHHNYSITSFLGLKREMRGISL